MIPVLNEVQREEIEAVSALIKAEVNVKEIELLDDASGILVKQIKPNFKVLGPKYGKDMKLISSAIQRINPAEIQKLEQTGVLPLDINGKKINLEIDEVEISSQDIEGWLVANSGALTVALDVTITEELREEGVARELVNRIQNLRKDSGFEVTDRIHVKLQKNGLVEQAVRSNLDYIKAETLTAELDFEDHMEKGTEVVFDDIQTRLFIQKH